MAMYEIVPETPLAAFTVNTRTRDLETAHKLAAEETREFGVPHTVEEVQA